MTTAVAAPIATDSLTINGDAGGRRGRMSRKGASYTIEIERGPRTGIAGPKLWYEFAVWDNVAGARLDAMREAEAMQSRTRVLDLDGVIVASYEPTIPVHLDH